MSDVRDNVNLYVKRQMLFLTYTAFVGATKDLLADLFRPIPYVTGATAPVMPPLHGHPWEWDITSALVSSGTAGTSGGYIAAGPGDATAGIPIGPHGSGWLVADVPVALRIPLPQSGRIYIYNGNVGAQNYVLLELSRYRRTREEWEDMVSGRRSTECQ